MNFINKIAAVAALITLSTQAFAQDCGWSDLTEAEQTTLNAGQYIMRADFNADGIHFQIDQWGFSTNPSLQETAATFFDLRAYKNIGGIADIDLAEGEVAGNNPVLYVASPKPGNPFGDLYQPFTFSSTLSRDGDGYNIRINYLTSPKLIHHVYNNICLANVEGKVLIRFLSTVEGNPEIPLSHPKFGPEVRKGVWKSIFSHDVVRASNPATAESLEVFEKALRKSH